MPAANGKDTSPIRHLLILTQKDLRGLVPYTPQHILRLEKAGKFPRRIKLGQNRIGWRRRASAAWRRARTPPEPDRADPAPCETI